MRSIRLQSGFRRSAAAGLVCAGLITVVMASSALAVVVRHDRDLERTLELGQSYPYVGAAGGGSGTLVAPRWVLTAAHVVENFSPFDFGVRFGDREVRVVRTFIHPGEEETPWDRRTHDIALLYLEQAIDIPPARLYSGDAELGKTGTIVGVGFFGTAETGPTQRDGRRRAVTNRILDMEEFWLKVIFSRPPGGTDLEGVEAPGDSGGPLLIEVEGTTYVAGVGSYAEFFDAEGDEGTYGVLDFYSRVAAYTNWIESILKAVDSGNSVADEGPRPVPVQPAAAGLPETPAGRRATAYFEAFNSGDPDRFRDFTLEHRTRESVVAIPMKKRLGNYSRRWEEWGRLELREYAATGPQELSVLVNSTIGALTYTFNVAAEPPHKLSGILITN